MPTPAYIDTTLFLPLGGINGFELNGFAVNGVGFVDSPFTLSTFTLDPYRSLVQGEPQQTDIRAIYPSLLSAECDISVQSVDPNPSILWAARGEANVDGERKASTVERQRVSIELQVEGVSLVPAEYRTAYVLASHPSTLANVIKVSDVDALQASATPDEVSVSVVPKEYRTVTVKRGDS